MVVHRWLFSLYRTHTARSGPRGSPDKPGGRQFHANERMGNGNVGTRPTRLLTLCSRSTFVGRETMSERKITRRELIAALTSVAALPLVSGCGSYNLPAPAPGKPNDASALALLDD